jgi:putative membrane protein
VTATFWALALTFASLAALLHVYIFWMESIAWETKKVRRTFGVTAEQAAANKQFAFNQGFYNLFLAIITFVGVGIACRSHAPGIALIIAGLGSMVGAATVLVANDRAKLRAAFVQATFAKLGLLSLLVWALVK